VTGEPIAAVADIATASAEPASAAITAMPPARTAPVPDRLAVLCMHSRHRSGAAGIAGSCPDLAASVHVLSSDNARTAADRAATLSPAVLMTTVATSRDARLAGRLAHRLAVPWVIDVRGALALDGRRVHATFLQARAELRALRRLLAAARCVLADSPSAAAQWSALGVPPERLRVLPEGFAADEFAGAAPDPFPADGRLHLVHTGTFAAIVDPPGLTRKRLFGARSRQIDPLGETGFYLLSAMSMLKQRHPDLYGQLCLHCYGPVHQTHRDVMLWLAVEESVVQHEQPSRAALLAALRHCGGVFVTQHGLEPGVRSIEVPTNLFDALASERPILAALPDGDSADLVRLARAGMVAPAGDAATLSRLLEQLVRTHVRGGGRQQVATRARLAGFERSVQAAALQGILRAVAAGAPLPRIDDPWQALRGQTGTAAS
jgi:hypothetical protein